MNIYLKKIDYIIYGFLSYVEVSIYAYILYWHIGIALVVGICGILLLKSRLQRLINKRKEKTLALFGQFLESLGAMTKAGRSVENSIELVYQDFRENYNGKGVFINKFGDLVSAMHSGLTLKVSMEEFCVGLEIEEVRDFSNGFKIVFGKAANLDHLIHVSQCIIRDKIDTKIEVDALLSGKRYEIKIMKIMPFVLIVMLNCLVPEYMMPNYTTLLGRVVMSIAGMVIFISSYLSNQIGKVMF